MPKKERYSGKAISCWVRRKWKANTPEKNYGSRCVLLVSMDLNKSLRRPKLLEAQVERPPPRAIMDDLSLALDVQAANPSTPTQEEPPKPLPPPYISRRSSPAATAAPIQIPEDGAVESPTSATSATPLSPLARPHITRRQESGSSFESR